MTKGRWCSKITRLGAGIAAAWRGGWQRGRPQRSPSDLILGRSACDLVIWMK